MQPGLLEPADPSTFGELRPTGTGSFERRIEMRRELTAIIEREGDRYVALCPEVDVASQGDSAVEARKNLQEAVALFFETASAEESERRLSGGVYLVEEDFRPGEGRSRQAGS